MGEIMPLRLLKRERVDAKASAFFVRIRIVADRPRPFSQAAGDRRGRWRACARSGGIPVQCSGDTVDSSAGIF